MLEHMTKNWNPVKFGFRLNIQMIQQNFQNIKNEYCMPQRPEEPSFSFPKHLQVISKGFQEI